MKSFFPLARAQVSIRFERTTGVLQRTDTSPICNYALNIQMMQQKSLVIDSNNCPRDISSVKTSGIEASLFSSAFCDCAKNPVVQLRSHKQTD